MYTMQDWKKDGTFSAEPGQEIEDLVYWEFFNCMPPLRLPRNAGYNAGFLMSEPYGYDEHGATYAAFGRNKERYYFIGYINAGGAA